MTDVDGRELPYSTECPDCGCVCASTGLRKHRGSMDCKARAATRVAARNGLAKVHPNVLGMLEQAEAPFVWRATERGYDGTGALRDAPWTASVYAAVLEATKGWGREARIAALCVARSATGSMAECLSFLAANGDHAGLCTFLELDLPEPEHPEPEQLNLEGVAP